MFKIDSPGSTSSGRFKESPLPATRVTADWLNAVQDEIVAVIEQMGDLDLDKQDSGQLCAAITAYVAAKMAETLEAADEAATEALDPTKANVEHVITDDAGGDAVLNPQNAAQLLVAIQRMIGLGIGGLFTMTTEGENTDTQRTISFAGGLVMLKMGYHRETIVDEVTRNVTFTTPFPGACWNVMTQGVIAAPSIDRDMWMQIIPGNTTRFGFTVQFQTEDSQGRASSGVDWWAFGN